MNLAFHYLYRDELNNISEGLRVFPNPESLTAHDALNKLEKLLIDGIFFVPNALSIPTLYPTSETGDHDYHEAEGLEETNSEPEDSRTFVQFLDEFADWKKQNPDEYW
jgi:hypothetical protein